MTGKKMLAMTIMVVLIFVVPKIARGSNDNVEGIWQGTLNAPGLELRVVFRISRKSDGTLTATIDSPDQGAFGIPVDEVTFENGKLYIESKRIQGIFEGKINEDASAIEGQWKQGSGRLPLVVKRVTKVPEIHRQQQLDKKPRHSKLIPPDKLKEDLGFLFKTIEEVHPNMYAYTSKESFAKLREELYGDIVHPMNNREFYRVVAPAVAALKNGHTYLCPFSLTGEDKVFPIGLHWNGEDVILQNDYAGNTLPLGGTVLAINGKDARKVIQKIARYFPDECKETNPRAIEHYGFLWIWLWLEYGQDDSLDLKIKNTDGEIKEYSIKPISLEEIFRVNESLNKNKDALVSYKHIAKYNAGIIEINSFGGGSAEFRKFLESTFSQIKKDKVSNLIVDIRKNKGGNSGLGDILLDYLTNKSFRQFEEYQEKVSVQAGNLRKIQQNIRKAKAQIGSVITNKVSFIQPKDNPLRFKGRKFVLAGRTTYSSANSFASAIKCFDIATLIGEETGGTTTAYGDCLHFSLPNSKLRFDVAYKYFVEAGGKPDGHGVIPDYEVKQKPEDTAQGLDTVLQFALDLIKKQNISAN